MFKNIKSNSGSTLLIALIVISVLSILSISLVSMTIMNINMKYNDKNLKKTLYYAESGIDQLYAYVGKEIGAEINNSSEVAQKYMNNLINNINEELASLPENPEFWQYRKYYKVVDGEVVIDEVALKKERDRVFSKTFRKNFNNRNYNDFRYKYISENQNGSELDINIEKKFSENDNPPANNLYSISVESNFTYNKLNKTIRATITVKDPKEKYPLVLRPIEVEDNPIWHNPLVSSCNIVFDNCNTSVDGVVYAYGVSDDNVNNGDKRQDYGIKLKSGNPSVSISGDVVTNGYIELEEGSPSLSISDAHIYSNSMIINKRCNFANIAINNSNLYTIDDIELNGIKSNISIDGSYYGFSDGATHSSSSAIVINAPVTGKKASTIEINGKQPTINNVEKHSGILVAGTYYTNLLYDNPENGDIDWKYQSGESVAIKKNYIAYLLYYNPSDIKEEDINYITEYDPENKNESYYYGENIEYKTDSNGYDFAFKSKKDINDKPLNIEDKKFYYYMAYKNLFLPNKDDGLLVTGDSSSINIPLNKYIYTTGIKLGLDSKDKEIKFKYPNDNKINDVEYTLLQDEINNDYIYYINRLLNRDDTIDNDLDYNSNAVDYYLELNNDNLSSKINKVSYKPYVKDRSINALETVYISNDIGKDLYIIGKNGYLPSGINKNGVDIIDISKDYNISNELQGLIITKSNVHIYGDIDFVGSIITSNESSIHINSGTQYFYNNDTKTKNYLAKLIRNTDGIRDVFDNSTDIINLGQIIVDMTDENNQKQRYKDLVNIINWSNE
jgi:hypothetical protein